MSKYILSLILFTVLTSCASEDNNTQVTGTADNETQDDITPPSEVILINSSGGDEQVIINWVNPTDSDFSHVFIEYSISGIFDSGTVNTELEHITINDLSNQSSYLFILHSVDLNGNVSQGIESVIMPNGVVSSDSIPPIIEIFTINETTINTTLSARNITGNLTVYDNLGTIERTPFLAFSPGEQTTYSATMIKNDAESIDGLAVYSWSVEIPQSAQKGIYEVLTLQVRDNVGNHKNYSANELTDLGFVTTVENI